MLQQALVDHTFYLRITDLVHERADRLRGITATTQTAHGRHAWIVPTCYQTFFHQLQHLTLRHHRIRDIEAVELTLLRTVVRAVRRQTAEVLTRDLIQEIVVQRTVHLELERTDTMRHAFEIIALAVRKIVHRVHVPFAPRTMMRVRSNDTIHDRITEMHVRIRHIDLRTQHHLAFLDLTALHRFEQTQVLLNRAVAVRRCHTGFGRRTFLFRNLLRGLLVHIGLTGFDETDSQIIELLEIIGGIEDLTPFET